MKTWHTQGQRGAARHWVMGCGIALLLFVIVIGVAGYWGYTKVRENVDFGTFDAKSKVDPPALALPDVVLPPQVGGYTRQELTDGALGTLRSSSNNVETTGMLSAVYKMDADTVMVTAIPTSEAEAQKGQGPMKAFEGQKAEEGQGIHFRMAFGPEPVDMAMWANPNWTYIVQTTATQALPFAKEFQPGEAGAAPGESTPEAGAAPAETTPEAAATTVQ